MSQTIVKDGAIDLYSFIDAEHRERVHTVAVLPTNMHADWNGQTLNVVDWRIAQDGRTVKVEYQTRNDAYAPILDCVLVCEQRRVAIQPPNRSKHWVMDDYGHWRNTKTGQRSYC